MISFSLVRVILLEFDVAKNIEVCRFRLAPTPSPGGRSSPVIAVQDLFDITFCYFPITFTPPPDDPYGISSDDLIVALR